MRALRAAVIGAGHLGRFHAQKLAQFDGVELVGVADPVEKNRSAVAAECRTRAFADHRELLGRIDAAVVAAPTRHHHAIALDLLNRGVHLLVEKPLAATAAQADELVDAARRRGAVLQVGHVEQFNPALEPLRPHLGDPKYIEAVRAGAFTFRSTDVGVVLDLMIHDIDLVLSMVRLPVCKVEAVGLAVLGGHEDVANARLEFQGGCVAVLSASRVSFEPARRMHVWTPRAFASIDFAARTSTLVRPDDAVVEGRVNLDSLACQDPDARQRTLAGLLPRKDRHHEPVDALALELADFVESIRDGRAPRVPGEQGRDAVVLAERILTKIAAHVSDVRPLKAA